MSLASVFRLVHAEEGSAELVGGANRDDTALLDKNTM